ncbi:hypothetical protein BHE74_00010773 [Ensete ventricosum]|nr:hypothetical protein GW17_00018481 [Ensete ventricosum]RWW80859.1 hypothetical protein BHE74_00010773 [Ensete ventricosum]RZS06124.1 hypothetical protein BHM03_00036743 [Ensete ventricosum]
MRASRAKGKRKSRTGRSNAGAQSESGADTRRDQMIRWRRRRCNRWRELLVSPFPAHPVKAIGRGEGGREQGRCHGEAMKWKPGARRQHAIGPQVWGRQRYPPLARVTRRCRLLMLWLG